MSGWATTILLTLIVLVYLILCIGFCMKCFVLVYSGKKQGIAADDNEITSPFRSAQLNDDDDEPLLDPAADTFDNNRSSFPPYNI